MDEPLDFSAEIERFEMKGAWSFVALPEAVWARAKVSGHKRWICTLNDAVSWHCAILPIGDGRRFVVTSKDKLKAAGADLGHHVHVTLVPDLSKYGMALPEDLEEMLEADPEFQRRFDEMKPGRRRGVIHHIASAKSEETVAKRIVRLMEELGMAEP